MPFILAVSAAELAAAAANKPLFLADNVLRRATAYRWTETGVITDPDLSDIDHLASKAFDGMTWVPTWPAVAQTANYYLNFTLPAGEVFDSLFLIHTIVSSACTLNVQIDDDPAWSAPITISSQIIDNTYRVVDLSFNNGVDENRRFEDFQNVRFHYTAGGGNFICPRVGEIVLARRRQLSSKAWYPFDDQPTGSEGAQFSARGGARRRHTYKKGFRNVLGSWTVHDGDYGLDDVNTIRTLWRECDQGSEPIVYIENPTSGFDGAVFGDFFGEDEFRELRMERQDVTERLWDIEIVELPPFVALET